MSLESLLLLLAAVLAAAVAAYLVSLGFLLYRDQVQGRSRLRARLAEAAGRDAAATGSASTAAGEAAGAGSASTTAGRDAAATGSASTAAGTAKSGLFEQAARLTPTVFTHLFARLNRRQREAQRQASYERELPALLEVIALGMRAGMGFDQAFELYACRFDTPLAQLCKGPLGVWQRGLTTRDAGMHELAEQVGTPLFGRFVATTLRSLRYGAPMTQMLAELAQESRKEYRAKREAMVAKAPVKMLLPTGALILPAMLLLVMGPIVLDLIGKLG